MELSSEGAWVFSPAFYFITGGTQDGKIATFSPGQKENCFLEVIKTDGRAQNN